MNAPLPKRAGSSLLLNTIFSQRDADLRLLEESGQLDSALFQLKHPRIEQMILGRLAPEIDCEPFAPALWQELALMEHQDKKTFMHSLGVTYILRKMIIEEGETRHYIERAMKRHLIAHGTFFAAALLHDIGKYILREIIHDGRTKKEWALLVNQTLGHQIFDPAYLKRNISEAAFDTYLHACGIDPIDCIPLEASFPKEVLALLEARGISRDITFRNAIDLHQEGTYWLLRRHPGMEMIAEIAAWHHSCHEIPIEALPYPVEVSALRIAVTQCLHLADTLQALISGFRSYKGMFHPLIALAIIIRDTKSHHLDRGLTKAFVQDQLRQFSRSAASVPANDPDLLMASDTVDRFVA